MKNKVLIPNLFAVVKKDGQLAHHAGKSTGSGPIIYDDVRSANRACGRIPDSNVMVISSSNAVLLEDFIKDGGQE